jgi:hypothetical protein
MYNAVLKIQGWFLIFISLLISIGCKKEHESPKDHLYIYSANGALKRRQYIRLKLSGDDTPKKKHETFTIASNNTDHIQDDYGLSIYFPSGAQKNTYFDANGKSNNNVTLQVTSYHGYSGTWFPVSGEITMNDHSTHLVPPFTAKGHISFANLMCIDTSSYIEDTLIISGELKYE